MAKDILENQEEREDQENQKNQEKKDIKKEQKVHKKQEKKMKKMQEKSSGKGIQKFIYYPVFAFLFFLIVFILLTKLDVGGLGSKVLAPKIKNIPVLNLILPQSGKENEEIVPTVGYEFEDVDQAVERLKATEIMLMEKEKEAEKLNDDLLLLNKEIDRLKVFEANQVQFEQDKSDFDDLVAKEADSKEFMEYVEKMNPENALRIYESLVIEEQFNAEVEEIAGMYQEMKPAKAADILAETSKTDIDMVSQILFKVDPSQAGTILTAMDPKVADRISRYMYPEKE